MADRILTLRVDRTVATTPEVQVVELVHPRGGRLPGYRPGAHVDLYLPGGFVRSYSLARAMPAAADGRCDRYVIGVKREPHGRGGSAALHRRVAVGDLLPVSAPRSAFGLVPDAGHHLLLAGGIGLTPLLCMAESLALSGRRDFTLAVFARRRELLPFADVLASLGERVRVHLDEAGVPEKLDLASWLAARPDGAHLYLCGPAGFMQAARAHAVAWPADTVHAEHFAPPPDGAGDELPMEPFTLRLARTGIDVPVGSGQTAVDALRTLGVDVPVSCEQGLCGTCVVEWTAGRPEHRDLCLSPAERAHRIALCRGRALPAGGPLVVTL